MHKNLKLITKGFFIPISLILVGQAAALRMMSIPEREVPNPGLHELPFEVGDWKSAGEQLLDPGVTAYLKPDEYVIRDYVGHRDGNSINLFLAYFKSVQNVYGPHSPSVCLPGSGWLVRSSKVVSLPVPGPTKTIPVNEYLLEKGGDRILTIFWYQNNRNIWAEEIQGKLKLLPDLMRYHRSDVSLVRIIAPIRGAGGEAERADCLNFIQAMFPKLVERFESTN